jgi:hypothetical protein
MEIKRHPVLNIRPSSRATSQQLRPRKIIKILMLVDTPLQVGSQTLLNSSTSTILSSKLSNT